MKKERKTANTPHLNKEPVIVQRKSTGERYALLSASPSIMGTKEIIYTLAKVKGAPGAIGGVKPFGWTAESSRRFLAHDFTFEQGKTSLDSPESFGVSESLFDFRGRSGLLYGKLKPASILEDGKEYAIQLGFDRNTKEPIFMTFGSYTINDREDLKTNIAFIANNIDDEASVVVGIDILAPNGYESPRFRGSSMYYYHRITKENLESGIFGYFTQPQISFTFDEFKSHWADLLNGKPHGSGFYLWEYV